MRLAPALLVSALLLPAPLLAEGSRADYVQRRDAAPHPEADAETAAFETYGLPRFVASNVRETMYHELAHLLIDQLELSLFGPEEFAADFFASLMINRLHPEPEAVAMTYDVAAAYDAGALTEVSISPAMWSVHGTDRQRYYNFVCMMYGANAEGRDDVARELGLPWERAETCEAEYGMAARAWGEVLDQIATDTPGTSLRMDWSLDTKSPLSRFVEAEVKRLNEVLVLPRETAVSVIPCEEVNAFYDPGPPEILICTELGDYLADLNL